MSQYASFSSPARLLPNQTHQFNPNIGKIKKRAFITIKHIFGIAVGLVFADASTDSICDITVGLVFGVASTSRIQW